MKKNESYSNHRSYDNRSIRNGSSSRRSGTDIVIESDPFIFWKQIHFSQEYAFLLGKNLETSLHQLLVENGKAPVKGTKNIGICHSTKEEHEYLNVAEGEALLTRDVAYDKNGIPVYNTKSVINPELYTLSVVLSWKSEAKKSESPVWFVFLKYDFEKSVCAKSLQTLFLMSVPFIISSCTIPVYLWKVSKNDTWNVCKKPKFKFSTKKQLRQYI